MVDGKKKLVSQQKKEGERAARLEMALRANLQKRKNRQNSEMKMINLSRKKNNLNGFNFSNWWAAVNR